MDIAFDTSLADSLIPLKYLLPGHLEMVLEESQCKAFFAGEKWVPDSRHFYLLAGEFTGTEAATGQTLVLKAREHIFPIDFVALNLSQVQATQDCMVLLVDLQRLDQVLTWSQSVEYLMLALTDRVDFSEDREWVVELLRSNLFLKIPPLNLLHIIDRFKSRYVDADEAIVRQGELGDCCYFIQSGTARVFCHNTQTGHQDLVADIGPGRCFGEDALINQAPRNATVIMRTSGILMYLEKNQFMSLLKPHKVDTITPQSLLDMLKDPAEELPLFVDIRTTEEYESGHLKGAVNVPLSLLKLKQRLLPRDKPMVMYCDTGNRSAAATQLLTEEGFTIAFVKGGLSRQRCGQAWGIEPTLLKGKR